MQANIDEVQNMSPKAKF